MSNSNYNKIISTINSVSQDYTYSPDPNNLICIDTSNNRIGINTIDPSCALHISGGDIQVNRIFANSVFASHYGATDSPNASSINATTISASTISATTISASTIRATTNIDVSKISVSSILDISKGLILANTISGSAITINANANVSSDIITIDIGTSTGVNINTPNNSTRNAITINGARVATTQHITNAIPYGVIVAYYSSTNIPNGWALCDGNNSTPDLRGRFILGSNPGGTGGTIEMDATYVYHKFLTVGSSTFTPLFNTTVDVLIVGGGGGGNSNASGGRGGAVFRLNNFAVSETSYNIVVGNGGQPNTSGGESSAFGVTVNGGVSNGGSGQSGTLDDILGTNYYWGGSGASGLINGGQGGGGAGYGGVGGTGYTNGGNNVGNGGANTGGGGGGYALSPGPASGGSGIVVIRYLRTNNGLNANIVNVSGGEENVSSFTTITGASSTTLATTSSTNIISFNNMPPYYVLVYIMKIETDFCYNTVITYPSAPIFSMSQINDTSVRLTWTQPSNIGNSPITQYKIYKNDVFHINVGGTIRTYDINNLDIGNTYSFSLTASNSILESNRAPIQSIQIMGVPIPPGIPRNLTNLTQGSNTITISWLVPIIIGNPALIGYIVNVDGTDKAPTTDLTYTESNVIPNRTYSFKVKSTSGSLTSDYTSIVSVTITVTPAEAPRNLTSLRTANSTLRLSWEVPTSLGSPNFTNYFINMNNIDISYVSANTLAFTKSDLSFDTSYSFKVRAAYNGIYSQYSNEIIELIPPEPVPPIFNVQQISGSTSVVIAYARDGFSGNSPIRNYVIYESDQVLSFDNTGTYVYSDLFIGSTYVFGVVAVNQNGYESGYTNQTITIV